MSKHTLVIADDELNIREGLSEALSLDGYATFPAADGLEALSLVAAKDADLLITDLRMPKLNGNQLLAKVAELHPKLPVIILTGHGTIEDAVAAMRIGAFDFLTKPVNLEHLSLLVRRALEARDLARTNQELIAEVESVRLSRSMVLKSAQMAKVFELVRKVAPTKANVLITGESGVGKEIVADAIHNLSDRRAKPLVKVHCASLAESLLESELFGHEKGSFTGASGRKKGRFELANEGTLLLDEIGDINKNVQIKILRVIQERQFERVGGEETIEVDVRIIAATNKDLKEEIKNGNFREDLFYRLNVVSIFIPPLRERRDDISLLARDFLRRFSEENHKKIEGFDVQARKALYAYDWPGNVRELQNCIESAVVLASGNLVTLEDLPPNIHGAEEERDFRIPSGSSLARAEAIMIRDTLAAQNGNKSKTAEVLGIGRKTLYQKLHDYGIETQDQEDEGI